jgi:hypothetical protein
VALGGGSGERSRDQAAEQQGGTPGASAVAGPPWADISPAQTRWNVARSAARRAPLPVAGTPLASKSSGQPPRPRPAVSRPPDSRSTEPICLASRTGLARQPTFSTVVSSSTCSVTAAAAAMAVSGSTLS